MESNDDVVIMDTYTNHPSPSLRITSNSTKFKTPKNVLKRPKKTTSDVWDDFVELLIDDDEIYKTICQWCKKDYVADSHNGITSLCCHLLKCPKWNEVKQNTEKEGNVSQRKISQVEFHEMLVEAIVKHNLPLTLLSMKVLEGFSHI